MAYYVQDLTDTIVALATPPGRGAIAVVRLSGPEARTMAAAAFRGKDLTQVATHTVHFGTLHTTGGELLDEVLATVFIGPNSYTGDDTVEISCHGSNYIVQAVIRHFLGAGARLARPGEYTLRAFLNGKMDLSQAEAVADLIAADSAVAHDVALRQLRGGFSNDIQDLRRRLLDFASLIELELDFGEEDVEFANRDELRGLVEQIQDAIAGLLQSFTLGNALKQGVTTVIAGRPNAGKSTLLNALLNEERALVSDIPGTTRDTIEEVLHIQGIPFRLIDTAGIRDAADTIEAMGVERTLEKVRQSSLLLYVFDVVRTQPADVRADLERLAREGLHILVVANKMDLNPYTKFEHFFEVGSGKAEVGSGKSEVGSGKSEVGSGKAEATGGSPVPDRVGVGSEPPEGETPSSQGDLTANENISLPDDSPLASRVSRLVSKESWIPIVAKESMNIPYLKEKLYDAVVSEQVNTDQTIVTSTRHYEALQNAQAALDDVLRGLTTDVTTDFVAMDIRRALHHLGEITGEISTDDLLGNIFGRFCIGK